VNAWWAVLAIIVMGLVLTPVYRWRARGADESERAALDRANRLTAIGYLVVLVAAVCWAIASSL